MSIIMTALALAAGAQSTPAAQPQPADHAQHQSGQKHDAKDCCCCKHMAEGKKMACCDEHEKARSGDHADHSAK